MELLPEIDDHVRQVAAAPDRTWQALVSVLAGPVRALPRPLTWAWGLEPRARTGWADPVPGSTIPGFVVAESEPPRRLTLRGRHRFSRYEIRFTLEPAGVDAVELHARTAAVFPGLPGRAYRTLVIGSGGHAAVVRRLLSRVARRAERRHPAPGVQRRP